MALNLLGLLCAAAFYLCMVLFGVCAARIGNRRKEQRRNVQRSVTSDSLTSANFDSHAPFTTEPSFNSNNGQLPRLHITEDFIMFEEGAGGPPSVSTVVTTNTGKEQNQYEMFFVAKRAISPILGTVTILRSFSVVKSGGIMPTATVEQVYRDGVAWSHVPLATCISLMIGFLVYSSDSRVPDQLTVADWFTARYGRHVASHIAVVLVIAETLLATVVLAHIAATMRICLEIDHWMSLGVSGFALCVYTLRDGIYGSALTHLLQYGMLWMALIAILSAAIVNGPSLSQVDSARWIGGLPNNQFGLHVDQFLAIALGSVPMQHFLHSILATSTGRISGIHVIVACVLTAVVSSLPVLVGIVATGTDWQNVTSTLTLLETNSSLVLQYSIFHFCGPAFAVLVVPLLASALLAAVDSALMAATTLSTHNIYRCFATQKNKDKSLTVGRFIFVLLTATCLCLALWRQLNLVQLWMLPFDLCYSIVFPQMFCVRYYSFANTYGALIGFYVGVVVRAMCGESTLGIQPTYMPRFWYPQYPLGLPYRTLSATLHLFTILIVSYIFDLLNDVAWFQAVCSRCSNLLNLFDQWRTTRNCNDSAEMNNIDRSVSASADRTVISSRNGHANHQHVRLNRY